MLAQLALLGAPASRLPPYSIYGTGFVVDDSGIVATARHFVQPFIDNATVDAAGQIFGYRLRDGIEKTS
jgi:hypothetical protein